MKKAYSEQLTDPRWQKMRLEVMERDGFACLACGDADSTLHVHHCYYVSGRHPWEYPKGSLLTFGKDCHATVNQQGTKANRWAFAWETEAVSANQLFLWEHEKTKSSPIGGLYELIAEVHEREVGPAETARMLSLALLFGLLDDKTIEQIVNSKGAKITIYQPQLCEVSA